MAGELKVSRSRLIAIALEEFIRRYQNRQLLEKINAAYEDSPDEEEQALLRSMSRYHRRIVAAPRSQTQIRFPKHSTQT